MDTAGVTFYHYLGDQADRVLLVESGGFGTASVSRKLGATEQIRQLPDDTKFETLHDQYGCDLKRSNEPDLEDIYDILSCSGSDKFGNNKLSDNGSSLSTAHSSSSDLHSLGQDTIEVTQGLSNGDSVAALNLPDNRDELDEDQSEEARPDSSEPEYPPHSRLPLLVSSIDRDSLPNHDVSLCLILSSEPSSNMTDGYQNSASRSDQPSYSQNKEIETSNDRAVSGLATDFLRPDIVTLFTSPILASLSNVRVSTPSSSSSSIEDGAFPRITNGTTASSTSTPRASAQQESNFLRAERENSEAYPEHQSPEAPSRQTLPQTVPHTRQRHPSHRIQHQPPFRNSTSNHHTLPPIPLLYYKSSPNYAQPLQSPNSLCTFLTNPLSRFRARKASLKDSIARQNELKAAYAEMRKREMLHRPEGDTQLPRYEDLVKRAPGSVN